jgi:hypothetical protein
VMMHCFMIYLLLSRSYDFVYGIDFYKLLLRAMCFVHVINSLLKLVN